MTTTIIEEDIQLLGPDEEPLTGIQEACKTLYDRQTGEIGRVVASETNPAGSHLFYFWASDKILSLDIGHIVVTFSEEAAVIGVVDEAIRYSDLRSFLDDYFDRQVEDALPFEPPSSRPEILVFTVTVLATKHLRDDVSSHRPPIAGKVYFATPEAIDYALGTKNFSGAAIPALMHTNGNYLRDEHGEPLLDEKGFGIFQRAPIWLDEDYLLGPEAGHANWTGQSGLATKTSHSLFLISSVFQKLRAEGKSVAALMFNVKGPDLLWLDKPALPEPDYVEAYRAANVAGLTEHDLNAYAALGLKPEPFEKFRIFAPFKPSQQPRTGRDWSNAVVRLETERYHGRLNTLRTAPNEAQGVVYPILWQLGQLLNQVHRVFSRDDLDDKLFGFVSEIRDERNIASLSELNHLFDEIEASFADGASDWRGHHKFTIRKARNRFNGLTTKFGGLLTDGLVEYGSLPKVEDSFSDGELRVVDIAHCNTNVQELLVSQTINEIWHLAEQQRLGVDKVIIFVDELNKYAASGSESGLRDTLVDIAARGRHLNVVLFGAQQFRSKVDGEILGNCGTSFYGRIGDEEIINPSYRSISEAQKQELLGLPKGRLLVRHAHFRAPLFGVFPRPPAIAGMSGQRVFNDATGLAPNTHPSDGLFRTLQNLMGSKHPSKNEVRAATDGLDANVLQRISGMTEQQWEKMRTTSAASRFTPWSLALNFIKQQQRTGG
jgi:hypothetical protein